MAFRIEEQENYGIKSKAKQPLDFAKTKDHDIKYRLKKFPAADWKEMLDANKSVGEILAVSLIEFEGCGVKAGEFNDDDRTPIVECGWLVEDLWAAQMAIQNGRTYGMKLGN
jgi:hypothetical protein